MLKLLNLHNSFQYSGYIPTNRDFTTSENGCMPILTNFDDIEITSNDITTINEAIIDSDPLLSQEEIIKMLFMEIEDTFGFVSSCDNGCTKANFYEGTICPTCGTEVRTFDPSSLKFRAQFKIPEQYPPILHPIVYRVLNTWLGKINKVPVLETFFIKKELFPQELSERGFQFGLSYFHEHFDEIINFLLTDCKLTKSKDRVKRSADIPEFLLKFKDRLFIRNLPILNQTLHILTKFGAGKRLSDSQVGLIMQINGILGTMRTTHIRAAEKPMTLARRNTIDVRLHKIASTFYKYCDEILRKKCSGKKGFTLQNIVAGRLHNTFRTVIVPITTLHDGDELHIPWKVGVEILELEILNLLRSRFGYSHNDAIIIHNKAKNKYIPDVYRCMQALIKECPYKGLPVLWNRNPSLNQGSIQLLFITVVKTSISDKTTGMSQAIINGFNADFDGDEMNAFLIKEMGEVAKFMGAHPIGTLLDSSLSLTDNIEVVNRMPIHNWLNENGANKGIEWLN